MNANIDNFIQKLATTKKDLNWNVESSGAIRANKEIFYRYWIFFKSKITEYRYCPLSGATNIEYMDAESAGKMLNLNQDEIFQVIMAADDRPNCNKELRQRMLDALDLKEQNAD